MKSPIQLIKDGILEKDFSLVIQGYTALTGDSITTVDDINPVKPEPKPKAKKKTASKKPKSKPKPEPEIDLDSEVEFEDIIDTIPVAGPKEGMRSGPINMKNHQLINLHQTSIDEKEIKTNIQLSKAQKLQKAHRPDPKSYIKCPECKNLIHKIRHAEKYIMGEKDHTVRYKCVKCKSVFTK